MRILRSGVWMLMLAVSAAAGETWSLYPCAYKPDAKDYAPTFDKHFKVVDGVLTGNCGMPDEFYKAMEKHNVFVGTGPLWATQESWPKDAANFELVFDYKWFQEEPMAKFGDFPDLHVGFRLNKDGMGYYLTWGMLGQVLIKRMASDHRYIVGHGTHPGLKGKWAKVKIRAAGPILKVKIWSAAKPEPEAWTAEGFDQWPENEPNYKTGAVAVGFFGRKLFNTCVYEFKDAQFKVLSDDEVKSEKSFDAATAPQYAGRAPNSDTTLIKVPEAVPLKKDDLADFEAESNAKIESAADGALVISSTNGEPAFLWKKSASKARALAFRVKSSAGARPLFGIRLEKETTPAYMDPVWRPGFVALCLKDNLHTAGAYRFEWKPDTWYDMILEKGHWQKWQIIEVDNPKNFAAFSADMSPGTGPACLGIGAAGKGTVTVQSITLK
jgi:hypothetical protein